MAALLGLGAFSPPLPFFGPVREVIAPSAHAQYGTSRRVARRTSRRTSARHNAYYGAAAATGVAVTAGAIATLPVGVRYVTALPAGCVEVIDAGVAYQRCGGGLYRPYYQGTQLVYVPQP